jgi:hypothetical protein
MGRRHPNPRCVKIHRPHSVEEAAHATGTHPNTVRNWIRAGLTIIEGRPMLIPGRALFAFLSARRSGAKQPLKAGEIYCLKWRAPKRPALGMVDYVPHSATAGNLRGICPDCERLINRKVSLAKLECVAADLTIQSPQGLQRIKE